MLPVDWVFPTPSVEKRRMYQWTGDMLEERQRAYKSIRDVQDGRVLTDWRLDEGELTELPEAPQGKAERRSRESSINQRDLEISPEPELEIQVIPEDPE